MTAANKHYPPYRKQVGKVAVYADSHGQGLTLRLNIPKHKTIGIVKSCAPAAEVLKMCKSFDNWLHSADVWYKQYCL